MEPPTKQEIQRAWHENRQSFNFDEQPYWYCTVRRPLLVADYKFTALVNAVEDIPRIEFKRTRAAWVGPEGDTINRYYGNGVLVRVDFSGLDRRS